MTYFFSFEKKMDSLISSCVGATVAEFCTVPLCVTKTTQVVNNLSFPKAVKLLYKEKGFYRGTSLSILSQGISTSIKYSLYRKLQEKRRTSNEDFLNNSLNGICSGILGGFLSHPIDVIKTHRQRGLSFSTIQRSHLYRGYSKNVLKTILLSSMMFPALDYANKFSDSVVIRSAVTAFSTSLLLYPVDYFKVRQMAGVYDSLSLETVKRMYRGYSVHLLRIVPHLVITMKITETLEKELKKES